MEDEENEQADPSNRSKTSEKAQPVGAANSSAQSQAKPGQTAAAKSGASANNAVPPRPAARPDARKALTLGKMQSEDRRGRRATLSVDRQGTSVRRQAKNSEVDTGTPTRGGKGGAGARGAGGRGKRG